MLKDVKLIFVTKSQESVDKMLKLWEKCHPDEMYPLTGEMGRVIMLGQVKQRHFRILKIN